MDRCAGGHLEGRADILGWAGIGRCLALLLALSTSFPAPAQASGRYPPEAFNGLQIVYTLAGATVTGSEDVAGDANSLMLRGYFQPQGELRLSGTAWGRTPLCEGQGQDYFVTLSIEVWVDGERQRYEVPQPATCEHAMPTYPFNLGLPIPAGAKEAGFRILETWINPRFGNRSILLSGQFTRKEDPAPKPSPAFIAPPGSPAVPRSPQPKATALPGPTAPEAAPAEPVAAPSPRGAKASSTWMLLAGLSLLLLPVLLALIVRLGRGGPGRAVSHPPPVLPSPSSGPLPSIATHVLEAWFPGGRVVVFPLAEEMRLGRGPGNRIRLDDPSVSSRHALLRKVPGGFLISDLGSTNGTWVGGIRISEPVLLRGEEVLHAGDVGLAFRPR